MSSTCLVCTFKNDGVMYDHTDRCYLCWTKRGSRELSVEMIDTLHDVSLDSAYPVVSQVGGKHRLTTIDGHPIRVPMTPHEMCDVLDHICNMPSDVIGIVSGYVCMDDVIWSNISCIVCDWFPRDVIRERYIKFIQHCGGLERDLLAGVGYTRYLNPMSRRCFDLDYRINAIIDGYRTYYNAVGRDSWDEHNRRMVG